MTDLLVMPFRAVQAGYAPALGDGSQRIALEGGGGRYRAGAQAMAHLVNATYVVAGQEYDLLMGFWRAMRRQGGGPFHVDLVLDASVTRRYTAHFLPQTAQPRPIGGMVWTVTFQLEVETLPEFEDPDLDFWAQMLKFVEIYGSIRGAFEAFNHLEKLVNEDLPHAR